MLQRVEFEFKLPEDLVHERLLTIIEDVLELSRLKSIDLLHQLLLESWLQLFEERLVFVLEALSIILVGIVIVVTDVLEHFFLDRV